jgi:hypothetical protein
MNKNIEELLSEQSQNIEEKENIVAEEPLMR